MEGALAQSSAGERLLAEVNGTVAEVLASVARLSAGVLAIARGATRAGRPMERGDLLDLRPTVTEVLIRHAEIVVGAGVVAAPGALSDAPLWIEWYWSREGSEPERLNVDLDPSSAEFWDYTTLEWYREPMQSGETHVAGPYVDYICTHDSTVTLSSPVLDDEGRFIGIAGADILTSRLELSVLPTLREFRGVTALASTGGRVIASNSPQLLPGMLLSRSAAGAALKALPAGARTRPGGTLPWTLFTDEGD